MSPSPHLPRHHHRAQRDEEPQERPARGPLEGPVLRLTAYLNEDDQYRHRPLYAEIVHRAHRAGLAGASVFRGLEGFGRGSVIHTSRLLDLAECLPVAVVVVDEEWRVRSFAAELREIAADRLMTLDRVELVAPGADPAAPAAPAPQGPAGER
jgi:PII-like signaling protein